jgi:hypothetical protein
VLPLERRVQALQEAYIRKVVDTVHDLPNALYEVADESSGDDADVVRFADDCVPRTLKEDRCRRRFRRMRCCMRDGGWPSAVALQGEAANHRGVRRSRAGVLSVAEKARHERVRCGSRRRAKANHR